MIFGAILYFLLFQKSLLADDFEIDTFYNVYRWNSQELVVQSKSGMFVGNYSESSFGDIEYVDVRDPLKPLVFFRNSSKFVLLDNTLSPQGEVIDLFEVHLGWVSAVCSSIDQHYWLFDVDTQELIRLDASFKEVTNSGNLTQLTGISMIPSRLWERDSKVYALTEDHVIIFDLFGTFLRKVDVNDARDVHITPNGIVKLHDEGVLSRYNMLDYQFAPLDTIDSGFLSATFVNGFAFGMKGGEVSVIR